MARPRKPTNVLSFTGAFKKDPKRAESRKDEPKPSGEIGDAPDHLNTEQEAIWKQIVALSLPGVLSNADRIILEELCCAIAARRNESNTLRGVVYDTKLGAFIKACCEQLGMTPAARSKVTAKSNDKEKENSFAAL